VTERTSTVVHPFPVACSVRPLGEGSYATDLAVDWTVGSKPHGGYLLALLTRAAVQTVGAEGSATTDPVAVSAQFLSAPAVGPALVHTEVRKSGRTATVVFAQLEQRGQSCVEAMVTVGRLPGEYPAWMELPDLPAEPPLSAVDLASLPSADVFRLSAACDVRLDPAGAGFLEGRVGDPLRLRLWVRPREDQPDPLFALVAGDVSMPVTFNLGRFGWSPTVQLTALLRARPAPGWLRVQVESRAVHGQWFDEDATVIDSAGRLVCQCRQLALSAVAPFTTHRSRDRA
jgi:hypothetical protein